MLGQGTNSTIFQNNISGGDANSPMVTYQLAADASVRISTIQWDGNSKPCLWFDNQNSATAAMTGNRVDHCLFRRAGSAPGTPYHAVKAAGYVYGLVDHCEFTDCVIPFEHDDRDGAAWSRSPYPGMGTTNCWVVEDCTLHGNSFVDMAFYVSNGGRLTWRYNTESNNQSPGSYLDHDCHGNNQLLSVANGLRGTIFLQYYGNAVAGRANFSLRGGHMMVMSNSFTSQPFPTSIIGMTEEEFCRPDIFGGRTPYPAGDMITNSFIWSNTGNGSASAPFLYCDSPGPDMISENRDYWTRAPQSGDSANVFPLPLLAYPHPRIAADSGGGGGTTGGTTGSTSYKVQISGQVTGSGQVTQ